MEKAQEAGSQVAQARVTRIRSVMREGLGVQAAGAEAVAGGEVNPSLLREPKAEKRVRPTTWESQGTGFRHV